MAERDADAPGSPELPPNTLSAPAGGHGHGISIYKSGQGYWTRVCTAIGLAFILLSAVAWLWEQCKLIDIPTPEWNLVLDSATGNITPGETMTLAPAPKADGAPVPFATARVKVAGSTNGRRTFTVENVVFTGESHNLRESKHVASETGAFKGHLASIDGVPIFPMIYLQGGAATALVLVGGLLIYWLVGLRHRSVDFLIATDAEMKKVNWSSRKTIMDSTWMVVLASVLISALIYIIDLIFQWFFAFIGVLDH